MEDIDTFSSMLSLSMDMMVLGRKYSEFDDPLQKALPWFEEKLSDILKEQEMNNTHELMEHIAIR